MQVVNLQAELAYIQARLSSLQCLPLPPPQPAQTPSTANLQSSHLMALNSNTSMHFDSSTSTPVELVSLCDALNQEIIEDGDAQALAREFVSKYLPGVKFQWDMRGFLQTRLSLGSCHFLAPLLSSGIDMKFWIKRISALAYILLPPTFFKCIFAWCIPWFHPLVHSNKPIVMSSILDIMGLSKAMVNPPSSSLCSRSMQFFGLVSPPVSIQSAHPVQNLATSFKSCFFWIIYAVIHKWKKWIYKWFTSQRKNITPSNLLLNSLELCMKLPYSKFTVSCGVS